MELESDVRTFGMFPKARFADMRKQGVSGYAC